MCMYTLFPEIMLELFDCAMETNKIYGLNWPNAKSGELVIVKCSAFSDKQCHSIM